MAIMFSVVILFDNHKYEFQRAIESVFHQTEKCSEIVIVYNDNKEVIDSVLMDCENEEVRIHCVRTQVLTECEMFLIGIKNSTCDYVALLHSDDYWENNKLELCKKVIDSQRTDIIITSYYHKIYLNEIVCDICNYPKDKLSVFAYFQLCYAPSSVVLKTTFALFNNINSFLKVEPTCISNTLVHHHSKCEKNIDELERVFWKDNINEIRANGILNDAIDFSLYTFHGLEYNIDNLMEFLDNIHLEAREIVEIMVGRPIIWNEKYELRKAINQKSYNYLLVRDWLELKITGKTLADKLLEKNIKNIAVYGAGRHGAILFDDLARTEVSVVAWIDKNKKERVFKGVRVIAPNEYCAIEKDIDAIVVSISLDIETLKNLLNINEEKTIISLEELIRV